MSLIRVDLDYPIEDGLQVTFKAPCDSKQATGLKIYYPAVTDSEETTANATFTFGDSATYNISGTEHLFVTGAYVSVILDTTNNRAYLQNGDTNHYLEAKLASIESDLAEKANTEDIGNLWVWEKKNASTLAHIGYVAAPSSTAYPTDGTSGGYRYTRLGQIGEGMPKIETGSYVGTGTYGSSKPNVLTFPFAPKLFSIYGIGGSSIALLEQYSGDARNVIFPPQSQLTTTYVIDKVPCLNYRNGSYGKRSADGKTIYWYNDITAAHQLNESSTKYYYFAIG